MSDPHPTPADEFAERSQQIAEQIGSQAIAIFTSLHEMPGSGDFIHPYRQDANLLYLCGIEQPDTHLLIRGCDKGDKNETMIFLRARNEQREQWEGADVSPSFVKKTTGCEKVCSSDELWPILHNLAGETECFYLSNNEHSRANHAIANAPRELIEKIRSKFPLHKIARIDPIIHRLRMRKSASEIKQIRAAIEITQQALVSAWSELPNYRSEYELEAKIAFEMRRRASSGFAFQPIVASGKNSCTLHYTSNSRQWENGEIILMDVGAMAGYYSADITRVVPVGGVFSRRQIEVYNAVLATQRYAATIMRPGKKIAEIREQVTLFLAEQLKKLKLIDFSEHSDKDQVVEMCRPYFMHGIGHSLGLDVHDAHPTDAPYEEGMVVTIEPGIYIREEGIGIRLEDDYLIGKNDTENLSLKIPIEIADIEQICGG